MARPYRACFCTVPGTRGRCPDYDKRGHTKWFARVEAPATPDGRRRQPRIGPFDTEKECKEAFRRHGGQVATAAYADGRKLRFRDYANQRYEWRRADSATGDGLKANTLSGGVPGRFGLACGSDYLVPGSDRSGLVRSLTPTR
jgi:prepilin-type processing-associated H-X9-DG protein